MNQQKAKTSYKYDIIFSLTWLQIQRYLQHSKIRSNVFFAFACYYLIFETFYSLFDFDKRFFALIPNCSNLEESL